MRPEIGFGLPLIAALAAGVAFPWLALEFASISFLPLIALMFVAGAGIDTESLRRWRSYGTALLAGLIGLFFTIPLVQLLVGRLLFQDTHLVFGTIFSAMMPAAIVAPYFTRLVDGDETYSFLLMAISHLFLPLALPLVSLAIPEAGIPFSIGPMFRQTLALVVTPLVIALALSFRFPRPMGVIRRQAWWINMLCLSLLVFPLFGTAAYRISESSQQLKYVVPLIVAALTQDFGALLIIALLARRFLEPRLARSVVITLAMKNTAVAAAILLFHSPSASVPAAFTFVAHAVLFSAIPLAPGFFSGLCGGVSRVKTA